MNTARAKITPREKLRAAGVRVSVLRAALRTVFFGRVDGKSTPARLEQRTAAKSLLKALAGMRDLFEKPSDAARDRGDKADELAEEMVAVAYRRAVKSVRGLVQSVEELQRSESLAARFLAAPTGLPTGLTEAELGLLAETHLGGLALRLNQECALTYLDIAAVIIVDTQPGGWLPEHGPRARRVREGDVAALLEYAETLKKSAQRHRAKLKQTGTKAPRNPLPGDPPLKSS